MHVDLQDTWDNLKTAVFYINSNNGSTIFKDGTEIESIANRLVVFKSNLDHSSVSCTDQKARYVINLNYYDK
jgi:Rps23 Pro-64 3,4-dihydroxylase Tpa1-like proline 4-hydroxylase